MTRGCKPVVAIGEAKRKAQAWGFMLIAVVADTRLPFDFVINDQGCISLVRVRRLKYAQYCTAEIQRLCAQEIAELRQVAAPEGIFRELWVRGPDRTWHRYLVLSESIEPLENERSSNERSSNEGGSPEGGLQAPGSLPMDQGTPQPERQPEGIGLLENAGLPEKAGVPENARQLHITGLPDSSG
jgi:hypothetical protein